MASANEVQSLIGDKHQGDEIICRLLQQLTFSIIYISTELAAPVQQQRCQHHHSAALTVSAL